MAVARIALAVAAGDEVDRHHVGDEGDIGMARRRAFSSACWTAQPVASATWTMRRWLWPPSRVRCQRSASPRVERHAELGQPLDRRRRVLDDELDRRAVVEAGAGDHRVLDMAFERVARLEHRGDPALRPGGRAVGEAALGEHRDLEVAARGSAPRVSPAAPEPMTMTSKAFGSRPSPRADRARVRFRNTSSRSASRVETSTMPRPSRCSAASTSPALTRSLR